MGRPTIFQWVSKYTLSYTRNGYTWIDLPTVYEDGVQKDEKRPALIGIQVLKRLVSSDFK